MPKSSLHIYQAPEDASSSADAKAPSTHDARCHAETVSVKIGEVLPALTDALLTNKSWLKDFENDEITLPYDLYEVILAYQHYHRLSA